MPSASCPSTAERPPECVRSFCYLNREAFEAWLLRVPSSVGEEQAELQESATEELQIC